MKTISLQNVECRPDIRGRINHEGQQDLSRGLTHSNIPRCSDRKTSTLLIIGATGFLGSHIAAKLAKKGYSLWIVARPGKHQTARGRVEQLFDWLEAGPWDPSKIRIIEGYLDQPDLGLNRTQYNEVLDHADEIIHCASRTSSIWPQEVTPIISTILALLMWPGGGRGYAGKSWWRLINL